MILVEPWAAFGGAPSCGAAFDFGRWLSGGISPLAVVSRAFGGDSSGDKERKQANVQDVLHFSYMRRAGVVARRIQRASRRRMRARFPPRSARCLRSERPRNYRRAGGSGRCGGASGRRRCAGAPGRRDRPGGGGRAGGGVRSGSPLAPRASAAASFSDYTDFMKMGRLAPAHLFCGQVYHSFSRQPVRGTESVGEFRPRLGRANLRVLAIGLPCRIDKFFGR